MYKYTKTERIIKETFICTFFLKYETCTIIVEEKHAFPYELYLIKDK
jgi:hypothetical protein